MKHKEKKTSMKKRILALTILPMEITAIILAIVSVLIIGGAVTEDTKKQLEISANAIYMDYSSVNSVEELQKVVTDFKRDNDIDIVVFENDKQLVTTYGDYIMRIESKIYNTLKNGDVYFYTNTKISGIFEVDHKKPFFNEEQDINIKDLTDEEIKNEYQLLTPDHNKLKDKQCRKCVKNKKRPPFLGKKYWYAGGENFTGSCVGCGYYDGIKWTEEFNNEEARKNARNNLIEHLYTELGITDIE